MSGMPAIAVQGVSKRYGSLTALNDVSLSVEQGEFFALLGPNGAGKTTLISILAGLNRPSSGTAQVLGHDVVGDFRNARRQLGVVPQELVFDPFFSVRETLRLQSGYFGLRQNDAWIDELLHHLGLTDKADTNMRQLSGGMKRRVLVAQALVHKPPVIILDEPTAGVDVELRQSLWVFIRHLNQIGHTILLTTHYLEEAEALCKRVAMLKHGRIIALENTQALLSRDHGRQLVLTLDAQTPMPPLSVPALAGSHTGEWILQVPNVAAIDGVLGEIRAAGVIYLDLEIRKPDLEDVFVSMMREATA